MSRRFARISLVAASISCWLAAVWAEEPPQPASQQELLVLRNGEVLGGRIARDEGYYRVVLADGELRVRLSDAELVCHNLDEAYNFKRNRLALGRADDHLDLADWCLHQALPGYAAKEISAAMALDPHNPRNEFLDRRLRQMLETPPPAPAEKVATIQQVTNEDLDRLVRGMPQGTVEAFTATIQPLLMNGCATSGCHGPGSKSSYIILRIPSDRIGTRRLTQRNLQSTVQMLDYQNPQQSRLLSAASRPHGSAGSAIFDPQTVKYRQLASWIALVTQKAPGTPDPTDQPATVGIGGQSAKNLNQASGSLSAGACESDARPAKPSYRNRVSKAITARRDSDAAGKDRPPPFPQTPQAGVNSDTPAKDGIDPFDAEAFNRQFVDPTSGDQNGK
ncbi:MAG TPA: hypothetical protein VGY55_17930 [Pirellulales bacterium]|jgi:hypothetical protein|nr:hypothetical protein [Pirellulales bacterium]